LVTASCNQAAEMARFSLAVLAAYGAALCSGARLATDGGINVCYFTNWARYRTGLINTGKDVFEMDLDASLCTHFMYGFATVTPEFDLKSNDPNADHPSGHEAQDGLCPEVCNDAGFKADWSNPDGERCDWPCSPTRTMRGYEAATAGMKAKSPELKVLISVGGWNFNDCAASPAATVGQGSATCELFSNIAASEESTRLFARNVIAFCRKWGFDGFDLDWEYPVVAGHNSNQKVDGAFQDQTQDYKNYISMLRVMKEEFASEGTGTPLLLTAAVGVGKHTVDTAYDIPGMNEHLDLINLMTYDLHGGWEPRTGCNANLYATKEDEELGGGVGAGKAVDNYPLSVSWAVDYWIHHGASPSKLTMGLATYGRGWKLANAADHGYNAAAAGASTPGASTKEAGYKAFYEIQELLRDGTATRYYDSDRECPYVVTSDGEWIGYDDKQSLAAKVDFAKDRKLAGTMVWALDLDDFTGAYEADGARYPLIRLMRERWLGGSAPVPTPAPITTSSTAAPSTSAMSTTSMPVTSAASSTPASSTSASSTSLTPAPSTSGAAPSSECNGGCSQCDAVPGNNQAATDDACAPCASGQTWWPCNLGLCYCASGGSSPTPAPSTSPSTTPTASASTPAPSSTTTAPAPPSTGCVDFAGAHCGGCLAQNGVCWDMDEVWCDTYKFTWCKVSVGLAQTVGAKVQKHTFLRGGA
jgi:GH18 family chitinase